MFDAVTLTIAWEIGKIVLSLLAIDILLLLLMEAKGTTTEKTQPANDSLQPILRTDRI